MIIYNVTIQVEHSVAGEWLSWLKNEHIPDMIGTGCFTHAGILRLLETDPSEGITYIIQYHAENRVMLDRYLEEFSGEMRKRGMDKWGNKFVVFRTILEVVH